MAGFIAWGMAVSRTPNEFRDAARDHRAEVIEHRPRHWKTAPQDLNAIAGQYRITAPAGFSLKEAKRCGISGKPVMHLVYTDGKRDVSVYVTGTELRGRSSVDGQYVGGFQRGLVVGSPAECRQFLDVLQRST
mgnify:CR=1 FL=1